MKMQETLDNVLITLGSSKSSRQKSIKSILEKLGIKENAIDIAEYLENNDLITDCIYLYEDCCCNISIKGKIKYEDRFKDIDWEIETWSLPYEMMQRRKGIDLLYKSIPKQTGSNFTPTIKQIEMELLKWKPDNMIISMLLDSIFHLSPSLVLRFKDNYKL